MILAKQLLMSIIMVRLVRPSPNNLESITLQWERFTRRKDTMQLPVFQGVASCWSLSKVRLREITKNSRATLYRLQASVSMLNVKVHDSIITKRLKKYGLFGIVVRIKAFFSKRTWQHGLMKLNEMKKYFVFSEGKWYYCHNDLLYFSGSQHSWRSLILITRRCFNTVLWREKQIWSMPIKLHSILLCTVRSKGSRAVPCTHRAFFNSLSIYLLILMLLPR